MSILDKWERSMSYKNGRTTSTQDVATMKPFFEKEAEFRRRGEIPPRPGMTQELEFITPEAAVRYLGMNFSRNRTKKGHWVLRLTESIRSGEFRTTHQGVAFDENGELIDGQNRLHAIVAAGEGVWLWVARGVCHEDVQVVDRGVTRSLADQIRIVTTLDAGHGHVAVAKAMLCGLNVGQSQSKIPDHAITEALVRHWDAVSYVWGRGTEQGITCTIRGMIGKAYYHVDTDILDRFMEVLFSGVSNGPSESAATKLRDFGKSMKGNGSSIRESLARKSISAIAAFAEGRPLTKLYEASSDPYPLPE